MLSQPPCNLVVAAVTFWLLACVTVCLQIEMNYLILIGESFQSWRKLKWHASWRAKDIVSNVY